MTHLSLPLIKRGGEKRKRMDNTSHFEIAIDIKTIKIRHVFIQTKVCVWWGENELLSF